MIELKAGRNASCKRRFAKGVAWPEAQTHEQLFLSGVTLGEIWNGFTILRDLGDDQD
jgi:hypothetical protein